MAKTKPPAPKTPDPPAPPPKTGKRLVITPEAAKALGLPEDPVEQAAEVNRRILAKRPRGRPPGSGSGPSTRRYNISLPLDVADRLDAEASPSATIVAALQLLWSR